MRFCVWLLAGVLVLGAATTAPAICGDGTNEPSEQCDNGEANGTPTSQCTAVCEEVIPALRIPGGGPRATDCQLEGVLDFADPELDRAGIPIRKQRCLDGDPGCDRDAEAGTCTFAFWVCVAATDLRLGCIGDHVASLEIRRPNERAGGPAAAIRAELLDKLGAYAPTGPGEVCSGRMMLRVPASRKALRMRLRTRNAAGIADSDVFKLRCE